MATWTSKQEVKEALQEARKNLKQYRKDPELKAKYLKECQDLQYVLDSCDAYHS